MKVGIPSSLYVLMGLILLAALVGSYFAFMRENERRSGLFQEAKAKILSTDVRRSNDPETGREQTVDTIVTFEYTIDGKRYVRTVRMNKARASLFVPWSEGKICYDPTKPETIEDAVLFPTNHTC